MAAPAAGSKQSDLIMAFVKAAKDAQAPENAAIAGQLARIETGIEALEARFAVMESMLGPSAQTTATKRAVVVETASTAAAPLPKGKKAAAAVMAAKAVPADKKAKPANARLYFRDRFLNSEEIRAQFDNEAVRKEMLDAATAKGKPIKHAATSDEFISALASYLWDSKKVTDKQKSSYKMELEALDLEVAHSNMPAQLDEDASSA